MGIILIQFTCRPDNILVAASAQTFMQSIRDLLQGHHDEKLSEKGSFRSQIANDSISSWLGCQSARKKKFSPLAEWLSFAPSPRGSGLDRGPWSRLVEQNIDSSHKSQHAGLPDIETANIPWSFQHRNGFWQQAQVNSVCYLAESGWMRHCFPLWWWLVDKREELH